MDTKAAIRLIRPSHWIKNVMVLLPVVFAMRIADVESWVQALLAAGAFCGVSSTVYIINDLLDRHRDRLHPAKRDRPIASGRVSPRQACVMAIFTLICSAGLWGILAALSGGRSQRSLLVLAALAAYLLLQVAYSFKLKRIVVLDVICIALGFVFRALAGALAIGVEVSEWLFVMAFTLCLFMGFCKRYNELTTLGDLEQAESHRATLGGYRKDLLTHLVTLTASIAVIGMVIYSLDARTVDHFGTNYLVYTLPIFLYGVFRFAMLSMAGAYPGPTELILRDRPFQFTVLFWTIAAMGVIYLGPDLAAWMHRTAH